MYDYDYDEDEWDDEEDYEEEDDPFYYCGCDLPGCIMPGEHYRSECHTAEDAQAYNDSFEEEQP